jgi:hypothetical protein
MFRITLTVVLLLAAFAVADASTANSILLQLSQALARDKAQEDWKAYLADAQRLDALLNGSPASTLEVAQAYLQLGDPKQALIEARRFVAMGQTHPLLNSTQFEPLRAALDARLARNELQVAAAHPLFIVSDRGLLPEDIDYDPKTKQFFVTSVLEDKIVTLDEHGALRDFAVAPDRWPMMALKVDARRRRLWATEVALGGFTAVPAGQQGHSVLLKYDLDRRTLVARYEGPTKSSLGDMVLAPGGAPIVSDGDGGGIFQLRARRLRRVDHGDFISPQTIAICPAGHDIFVPDYVRGLARLDRRTGKVTWIATDGRHALDGIDGLYCSDQTLIATQNGASPERVVAFALDASRSSIVGETLIERGTRTLGDPTHGVLVGDTFYYIANSGWDALDERGAVKPGSQLTPAVIMQVAMSSIRDSFARD